jgi:uncharacterized repeat protein (TIGR01451 family)
MGTITRLSGRPYWRLFFLLVVLVPAGWQPHSAIASTTQSARGADLATAARVAPDHLTAGNETVLGVSVTNHGPRSARNVAVVIAFGSGQELISVQPSVACSLLPRHRVRCHVGTLRVNHTQPGTRLLLFRIQIQTAGLIKLRVRAVSTTHDPKKRNNGTFASVRVAAGTASADLSVRVVAPTEVNVGDDLPYSITVRNKGTTEATGAEITLLLPAYVTFLSYSGPDLNPAACAPNLSRRPLILCLGTLATDEVVRLEFLTSAAPRASTPLTNVVMVSASTPDPFQENNVTTATTVLKPFAAMRGAELGVSFDAPPVATVGQEIAVRIQVKNLGLDSAKRLQLVLGVGSWLQVSGVEETSAPGQSGVTRAGCDLPALGDPVQCTLSALPSGGRWEVVVRGQATVPGTNVAAVRVSSVTNDPDPSNNQATKTVLVRA